jgi:hypothetical protein
VDTVGIAEDVGFRRSLPPRRWVVSYCSTAVGPGRRRSKLVWAVAGRMAADLMVRPEGVLVWL